MRVLCAFVQSLSFLVMISSVNYPDRHHGLSRALYNLSRRIIFPLSRRRTRRETRDKRLGESESFEGGLCFIFSALHNVSNS